MRQPKRVSIQDMKEHNKNVGHHWFDPKTMGFFGTRIESEPDEYNRFITSDDPLFNDYRFGDRAYSIREYDEKTGHVNTVGEFRGYSTLDEAMKARRLL